MAKVPTDSSIKHGIGFSKKTDAYTAAKDAAKEALKSVPRPKISFVFYSGDDYNIKEINKGLVEVLGGTQFIGGSTDALIYKEKPVRKGVMVVSLFSAFLNVSVASNNNVSKNPYKVAMKTAKEVVGNLTISDHINPLIQFNRLKKGNLANVIKIPSFFSFVLTRGFRFPTMGNEELIVKGLSEVIGQYIPLFGGSLGPHLEKIFNQKPYDIWSLHSGKIMNDGFIMALFNTGLYYENSIAHSCKPTNILGYISGTERDGFVISGISGKKPIAWYAEKLGITVDEFLKKQEFYTQKYPLGFSDGYGNFIIRAGGNPYKGLKMSYVMPFQKGCPVFMMDMKLKDIKKAVSELKTDLGDDKNGKGNPALCFAISCASRRVTLGKDTPSELKKLKKAFKCPVVGFYSLGEIGNKSGEVANVNHLCINVFNFFDTPLSQLK